VFLGSRTAKLQWLAIVLQICGLIITQYHPDTGSTYPLPSYAILFFQTVVTALAGVFNQHLCKSQEASLHAQNMVLYAFGVCINLTVHGMVTFLKPGEPGFFVGYHHPGAIFVIFSNVLNGLVITAVYKCKSNKPTRLPR
jgi:drug/metabolite transporter (DMT)-like permease